MTNKENASNAWFDELFAEQLARHPNASPDARLLASAILTAAAWITGALDEAHETLLGELIDLNVNTVDVAQQIGELGERVSGASSNLVAAIYDLPGPAPVTGSQPPAELRTAKAESAAYQAAL